jgi:hypothetical protein
MLHHLSQSKMVVGWQKQCNIYLEAKVHTFLRIITYYGPYVDCMKIVFGSYINHILTKLLNIIKNWESTIDEFIISLLVNLVGPFLKVSA